MCSTRSQCNQWHSSLFKVSVIDSLFSVIQVLNGFSELVCGYSRYHNSLIKTPKSINPQNLPPNPTSKYYLKCPLHLKSLSSARVLYHIINTSIYWISIKLPSVPVKCNIANVVDTLFLYYVNHLTLCTVSTKTLDGSISQTQTHHWALVPPTGDLISSSFWCWVNHCKRTKEWVFGVFPITKKN